MHRNQYLIDMCIMEGCTVLDDSCTECGTPDDWIDLWPTLDDAIRVRCSCCADMGERIVWIDGVPAVEKCPACGDGNSEEEL